MNASNPDPNASVKIDGEPLPAWLFSRELARLAQRRMQNGQPVPADEQERLSLVGDALQNAVEIFLLMKHASATLPPLHRNKRQKRRAQWIRNHHGLEKAAQGLGLSAGETGQLEAIIAKDIDYERLCENVAIETPMVPEEQAKAHYDAQFDAGNMKVPPTVYALTVYRDFRGDSIQDQADLLQAKTDFSAGAPARQVVATYSRPAPSGEPQFLRFEEGKIEPGFEELYRAAFQLDEGQCSDILQSEVGLHLLIVARKDPEQSIPYDRAKEYIQNAMHAQAVEKRLGELADLLRAGAVITGLPGQTADAQA